MINIFLNIYLGAIIVFAVMASFAFVRRKTPSLKAVMLTTAGIFIVPAVLGYLYVAYFSAIPERVVPNLRGQILEQAEERLAAAGLKSRHAGSVYDDVFPEGLVVSQRPEAGRAVKVGRLVSLLTSSGRRKVTVPNLLGRQLEQARAVLSAKGLLLGAIEENFANEVDQGIILFQSPLPEDEVEAGTEVRITVSSTEEAPRLAPQQDPGARDKGGFRFPWW